MNYLKVWVELLDIVRNMETERNLLCMIAAYYAANYYECDLEYADLGEFDCYVSEDSDDLLINIQNTMANVDKAFIYEEEEEYDEREETLALIEQNRRLNEQFLGL